MRCSQSDSNTRCLCTRHEMWNQLSLLIWPIRSWYEGSPLDILVSALRRRVRRWRPLKLLRLFLKGGSRFETGTYSVMTVCCCFAVDLMLNNPQTRATMNAVCEKTSARHRKLSKFMMQVFWQTENVEMTCHAEERNWFIRIIKSNDLSSNYLVPNNSVLGKNFRLWPW